MVPAQKGSRKELAEERWEQIRLLLGQRRAVRLHELCGELGISPATARRDLEALEQRGELRRVHGGAVQVHNRLEEPLFDDKAQLDASEKRHIAQEALKFVEAGETVFLDGGSTVLELARLLVHRKDLTVVTNSIRAAQELASDGPRLFLVGGELRRLSQTLVGPVTQSTLGEMNFDKAFMGTLGLTLKEGLTTTDPDEGFTKRLAMSRAGTVIVLVDSSKIGKIGLSCAGRLEDVDLLITDSNLDALFAQGLAKKGIQVVRAPKKTIRKTA